MLSEASMKTCGKAVIFIFEVTRLIADVLWPEHDVVGLGGVHREVHRASAVHRNVFIFYFIVIEIFSYLWSSKGKDRRSNVQPYSA